MLCIDVTPQDYKMLDSPVVQFPLNISDSLSKCSETAGRNCNSESQLDILNEFKSCNSVLEVSNCIGETRTLRSCNKSNITYPHRVQLEQDVQRLQQCLWEEMELHSILENAVEHTALTSSDLSCVPHYAQELLSNIATLEDIVSKLELETASLHFQLCQERNERRLAEYRLKHSPSPSAYLCSPENMKAPNAVDSRMLFQDKKESAQMFQHVGELTKEILSKGLWNHPNQLSEEMVRCMKNIFISLVDTSPVSSVSFTSEIQCFPLSPHEHLSSSSLWSLSERSMISSWVQTSQVDLQYNSEVLVTENASDPYRVRGKLCWADIGRYSLAVEVSWMSVGKKQLEYAAGALRRFRVLVEQLAKVNLIHLSSDEKLAFWINIYNALIMHAYLAYGVPRSDLKLFSLMQKAAYTVGGHSISAAAIEYVILKMKPPVHRPQIALLLTVHKLKVSEEQWKFSIDTSEPLAVFALSCGMYSSPAVRVYTAKNVREELQEAQLDFIRASVGVSSKGRLLVPKMLHCFARDFVDDSSLAVWISSYLPPHQAAYVEQCMSQRQQSFLGSRNRGILPFDSRFRYLFLPDEIVP